MLHLYESLGWWRAGAELRRVSICLSVCLSVRSSVGLSVCIYVCLCLSGCLWSGKPVIIACVWVHLCDMPFISLSVCLSVCPSVRLSLSLSLCVWLAVYDLVSLLASLVYWVHLCDMPFICLSVCLSASLSVCLLACVCSRWLSCKGCVWGWASCSPTPFLFVSICVRFCPYNQHVDYEDKIQTKDETVWVLSSVWLLFIVYMLIVWANRQAVPEFHFAHWCRLDMSSPASRFEQQFPEPSSRTLEANLWRLRCVWIVTAPDLG